MTNSPIYFEHKGCKVELSHAPDCPQVAFLALPYAAIRDLYFLLDTSKELFPVSAELLEMHRVIGLCYRDMPHPSPVEQAWANGILPKVPSEARLHQESGRSGV